MLKLHTKQYFYASISKKSIIFANQINATFLSGLKVLLWESHLRVVQDNYNIRHIHLFKIDNVINNPTDFQCNVDCLRVNSSQNESHIP